MRNNIQNSNFLHDIIAHPEDDGIRLIYADWLQDNGDATRADFIRLQIELHSLNDCLDRKDKDTGGKLWGYPVKVVKQICGKCAYCLTTRKTEELFKNVQEWPEDKIFKQVFPKGFNTILHSAQDTTILINTPFIYYISPTIKWSRGFATHIYCLLEDFFKNTRVLFASNPIEYVHLVDAVSIREYGGGDDRPTLWKNSTGPLWDLLFPDATPQDTFAEMSGTTEWIDSIVSDAAIRYGRSLISESLPLSPALST